MKRLLFTLILALVPIGAFAQAPTCEDRSGTLKLEWDAVIDPSVVEIGVFVADVSGAQDLTVAPYAVVLVAAGEQFAYVDGAPLPDGDHYFVATARNAVSTNSLPSNEVCATLIQGIPSTPQNLRILVTFAWSPDGGVVEGEVKVAINGEPATIVALP